ncbi:MAG TPA: hypothetical protein VK149_12210 [Sideroxyarcus sp.]|nr:hypothetical protein [Sideroxyarcus sp.]
MAAEDQAYHQTTDREIEFLEGIISGQWVRNWNPKRAVEALRGYLRTIDRRIWPGSVDVEVLRHKAKTLMTEAA